MQPTTRTRVGIPPKSRQEQIESIVEWGSKNFYRGYIRSRRVLEAVLANDLSKGLRWR